MNLSLKQLAAWAGGSVEADGQATGYSIDTRTLQPGDLFFALVGERSNGHDWVAKALGAGASAAVVQRNWQAPEGVGPLIRVDDPSDALRAMGAAARKAWGRPIVAITGSNGKTTTKDATAQLLASARKVSKTTGNLNNELGVPLTLLRIDDEAEVAVVEMGMNHAGEIRRLARLAEPNVGVVTNVSAAHVGFFDSVEEVAAAKRELIEELGPEGVAVLNADDPRVSRFSSAHRGRAVSFGTALHADFRVERIEPADGGSRFHLRAEGGEPVALETKLPGKHNVLNIAAAIAAAAVLGLPVASLREATAGLEASPMRGEVYERAGVRVIDDCYNANPASMAAALAVLQSEKAERRFAVLGEMRELGEQTNGLHREVGREAAFVDRLIGVGDAARHLVDGAIEAGLFSGQATFVETAEEAGDLLAAELRPGDTALFKGSRGVGLERARDRAFAASERENG